MPRADYSVVINDRMLRSIKTGVGHYTAQLLKWLPQVQPNATFVPFHATHISRRRLEDVLATRDDPTVALRQRFRMPWTVRRVLHAGYGRVFRVIARRRGYQLYHEPNHIPMTCDLPTVTTLHDLSVIRFPQWHPADRIAWYDANFQRGLERTTHFITVSRFTRDECVRHLGLDPERISVIHQAAREAFLGGPVSAQACQSVRTALNLPDRFLVFVGTIEPRKNLMGLLEAYAGLDPRLRDAHKLLVVGMHGWETESVERRVGQLGVAGDVRFVGYLSDERLAAVFTMATALVFPSRYEGFGLPPLEAMACGCPCVVSNAGSLPEVVGDAAIAVDPDDIAALTDAVAGVIEDPALRDDLAARGRTRAAHFSWPAFAQQHDAVYRQVLHKP